VEGQSTDPSDLERTRFLDRCRLMRNRYLDLLRFLAIVRVVVYHTSGWAFLTLVFPAMSVMFALAGSLMAASLDRSGLPAVGRRLRRLLPALWIFAALLVPAMLLTGLPASARLAFWIAPLTDPPSNDWGALATSTIWYLRDYLWFVLVSPVALWLFRRWPLPTLAAPYVLLVCVEVGLWPTAHVLHDFGLYFGAWLLGFAHHDGLLRRLPRAALVWTALIMACLGAAWIFTHPGPRGFDLNDIRIGNALWSAGFVLLLLGLAPARAAWVDRFSLFGRAVTVLNRRALTIYVWHMPVVVAVATVAATVDLGGAGMGAIATRLAVVVALVALAVALFGWVEDVSARRRPVLLPGGARGPSVPTQRTGPGSSAGVPAAGAPSLTPDVPPAELAVRALR
jgi:peptidoglycan/LPS O-acetylase OafA/YrhL